ncbi:DUF3306 domain-containing protein [Parasulfitobacter algicola]|uniref:DUF3306 domain-containing protein n=1 Tax=Parasulfitobacter algicola TaxID=2614809 RepID=A0ABX2IYA5_9RHOB|nr:DUF3306 domain-containing protein [Sulfitobacter algicola]NSX55569.1 DUF3306 domain-containing protein [Sulfitobacter algicola]
MTTSTDFWSRRKARVEAEVLKDQKAAEDLKVLNEQAQLAERSDDEVLAELNLPDPDTLKPGDDFSAFMKQAIPERIRRRALRKLWVSNPVLANVDNLVDYGEDFTDSAMAVENIQTAYQVGKGMLSHLLKLEQEAQAAEVEPDEVADAAEAIAETPQNCNHDVQPLETEDENTETEENETPVIRRKMRFEFAQET